MRPFLYLYKVLPLPLGEVARRSRDREGSLLPSQAEITDFGLLPQRGSQACAAPKAPPFMGELAAARPTEGGTCAKPLPSFASQMPPPP